MGGLFYGFNVLVMLMIFIIYGNGIMLLDIGEVMEVESMLGKLFLMWNKGWRVILFICWIGLDVMLWFFFIIGVILVM